MVDDAVVEKRLVAVALPSVDVLKRPSVANRFVVVLFVVDAFSAKKLVAVAFVALNLVMVPDADVRSEMVVVARVVRPFEINDEVAVIEPPVIVLDVSDVKNAVTPFRRVAKKLVDVALVVDAYVAKKLVDVLFVVVRLVIVPFVIVVVASVVVPSTAKRPDVVAFPCASTTKLRFSVHPEPFQ